MIVNNLHIEETFINVTEGYRFGDSEPYEVFTEDTGTLYRSLVQDYGRCTGKIYIDVPSGTHPVGWIFEKNMQYEDSKDVYKREVWVTLLEPVNSSIERLKYKPVYLD